MCLSSELPLLLFSGCHVIVSNIVIYCCRFRVVAQGFKGRGTLFLFCEMVHDEKGHCDW